jgi:ABC-type amino acid transport substrate-binding protein
LHIGLGHIAPTTGNFFTQNIGPIFGVVAALIILVAAIVTYREAKTRAHKHELTVPTDEASLPVERVTARQTTLERVLDQRILRVGCIVADPWFMFSDPNSKPTGIYPRILDDIADRNQLSVIYTPIRNTVIFDKLNSGAIDLAAQLLQTDERARRAEFAAYIHRVAMVAVVRKGQTKISSIADLSKPSVRGAAVKGEIGSEVATVHFGMTEDNDRLVLLDADNVVSVFYLVRDTVDVAITTGARWLQLKERDPTYAAQLEPGCGGPIYLIPAGSLIKSGEVDFKSWLERETAISRANPAIKAIEDGYIATFSEAMERI